MHRVSKAFSLRIFSSAGHGGPFALPLYLEQEDFVSQTDFGVVGKRDLLLRRNDPSVDIDVVDTALVDDAVFAAVADNIRVVSADRGVIFDHIVGQGGTSAYAEQRGIDADLVVVFGAQKISGRLAQCCLIQDRCCLIGACINRGSIVGTVDALIDLKLLRQGTCGVKEIRRKAYSPPG